MTTEQPSVPVAIGLQTTLLFGQNSVINVKESDFNLGTTKPITLKDKSCILILFYGNNTESVIADPTLDPFILTIRDFLNNFW